MPFAKNSDPYDPEVATLALLRERVKNSPWNIVEPLPLGYGFQIDGYGGENTVIILLSWGQNGKVRVTISQTGVDGGSRSRQGLVFDNWVTTNEEVVEKIWAALGNEISKKDFGLSAR